jgi:hypothetical protein
MKKTLVVAAIATLAILGLNQGALMQGQESQDVREARECVENYFAAFNKADNDALQEFIQYPNVYIGSNGTLHLTNEREEINFDAMRKREEWDHSTLDACEVSMEFKSKIHFNMIYSRHNADGTTYRTAPGHWIVAKKDGRWGVQLKSY